MCNKKLRCQIDLTNTDHRASFSAGERQRTRGPHDPPRGHGRFAPNQGHGADGYRAERNPRFIAAVPWGDTGAAIDDVERLLLQLLDATAQYADAWDEGEGVLPWTDEFSVPAEDVEEMGPEMRLAYVGRLLRSFGLRYGLGLGAPEDVLEADRESPAAVLRRINDILTLGF